MSDYEQMRNRLRGLASDRPRIARVIQSAPREIDPALEDRVRRAEEALASFRELTRIVEEDNGG